MYEVPTPEISVTELKGKLDKGETLILLDVREPHELKIANLPAKSIHIPLGDLADRLSELEGCKDSSIVIYCRSGRRSEMAANFMQEHGFKSVVNLVGGILAWADEIDSSVCKY